MSLGTVSRRRNEFRGFRRWQLSISQIFSSWEIIRASEHCKPPGKNISYPLAISFLGEHIAGGI